MMTKSLLVPAALMFGAALFAGSALAPAQTPAIQSPYGGVPVEEIVARVNDQIITLSDYNRAVQAADDEAKQHGATTMQEISAAHRDVLRDLIDQQLWLSKGKELDINVDTDMVKKLDDIRKQYHLDSIDDLAKAAQEQGISFEDFKASIRNGLITQEVMRQEVGEKITVTPGEVQRYYEQHKQDYTQPESEQLSEILISAGSGADADNPTKLAAALAKADDIEAKLHAGGDFAQLARSFSDGSTAAQGGELGTYQHGQLAPVIEQKTFPLQSGQYTAPIRTRQGYIILKVIVHTPGGPAPFADVKEQVGDAYYMAKMEPAIRAYLTQMRDEAYIDIRPGYTDTGASPGESKPVFSAYTPPSPKKKHKLIRTRYRESTSHFRQKSRDTDQGAAAVPAVATKETKGKAEPVNLATMKPGKKEKIRYGQAPRETLPEAAGTSTEDAGALPETASTENLANPLDAVSEKPEVKTRFSDRAHDRKPKEKKQQTQQTDPLAPAPADAAEVADRETQDAPLGLNGDTSKKKKKKKSTTTGEKTRLSDEKKPEQAPAQNGDNAPAAPQQ